MHCTSGIRRSGRELPIALLRLLAFGLLVAASLRTAQGQGIVDKRFALAVQPKYGVARGHAPLALTAALRWSSPQLVEGRLQLDWYVEQTRLGRYVASDLALSDSTLMFDVLLPPVILPHDDAMFSVQGKFITDAGTVYDLDVHDVALQPDWRRILVVAVCTTVGPPLQGLSGPTGDPPADSPSNSLARGFRLEPFFESRFTRRELLVDDTDIDPSDVPTEPLQLTAFDLFVIPGESLAKLKPRQLDALLVWVRAGGSLCVFVDSVVPQTHLDRLNQLAGRDPVDAAFLQGPDGTVIAADPAFAGLSQHDLDFGRVVTILGDPAVSEDRWKQAVLFLWKVREDRRRLVQQSQLWKLESRAMDNNFVMPATLEPERIWQQADLTKLLLPDSVRGLPLSTVGLLLVVFLLVISPGDYYLLGWLKRRRWTWVLFPCLSLLFTGYTMWLARQHLGQTSYDHAITVVDLGADDEPVRTSRFEMLYTASNRRATTDLQQEMMVPLDPVADRLVRRMLEPRAPREYEQPWTFSGRVPHNYTVQRDVQQWSPRMARRTTFGGSEVPLPTAATPVHRRRLSREATEIVQSGAAIPAQIIELADSITRRPARGYFSVVSQLSPTCGGNWEDLSLLDASSDKASVLVEITNPSEGEYVIIRRLQREPN
jgi:hypothetical protein